MTGLPVSSIDLEELNRNPLPASSGRQGNAVSVALIGVGGFGATHLEHLQELQDQGKARLVAVADPAQVELAAKKSLLTERGVRWYEDYREMLACEPDLQAVQIATPIQLHYEMALHCIERNLFVHLEKPPSVLIQQLEDLIVRDKARRVSIGFQHIDSVQIQLLKKWILSGKLGRIEQIEMSACWPRLGNYYTRSWAGKMMCNGRPVFDGPATNALSHLLHSLMFLAGHEQAEYAIPAEVQGEFYRARPMESYDLACLRGRFPSGIRFLSTFTHAAEQARPFWIKVQGERDWIRFSEDGMMESGAEGPIAPPEKDMVHCALRRSYENFLAFVGDNRHRVSTQLSDTRGYILTTNGGLISSGGIHTVNANFVRRYERDGDHGYDIKDIGYWMELAHQKGLLFSELGAPWAGSSQPVALKDMVHCPFSDYADGSVSASGNRG